jgi:hypothetical protein
MVLEGTSVTNGVAGIVMWKEMTGFAKTFATVASARANCIAGDDLEGESAEDGREGGGGEGQIRSKVG